MILGPDQDQVVRGMARAMAARYHEPADDLYGAAMLRLVRDAPKFNAHRGSLGAFVHSRATGAMLDHIRTWHRTWRRDGCKVEFVPLVEARTLGKLDGQERAVQRRELEDWLSKLKPRYAQAMRLYWFEGWLMSEIGERLGVNQSRVSHICKAALRQLRALAGVAA